MMRIAFVDFSGWDYNTDYSDRMPLGGSQSALCNLANALAKLGHQVFLLNQTSYPGKFLGVECIHMHNIPGDVLLNLDILVIQNQTGMGEKVKEILSERTALLLWTQHAHDQPSVQTLHDPSERDLYDAIVFVSDWQRDCFEERFGIDPARSRVLRNAIALPFCEMFDRTSTILSQKWQPPVLAYTSTPFRGLDLLLDVFPQIRQAIPGTQLKVFSSMKVYQVSENQDESDYGQLYEKCRTTEGVEFIGSLAQSELARELKSIGILAYPNTFAETSCIAVMEAMASGCYVITSHLGALPETTAGFARLIPVEGDWEEYKSRFVKQMIEAIEELVAVKTSDAETHLRKQVDYINEHCTWSVRALEWEKVLEQIVADKTAGTLEGEDLVREADRYRLNGEYDRAAILYEKAIERDPSNRSNYWHLGLVLLLQGQEADAQTSWLSVMMEAEEEQSQEWMAELVRVLKSEVQRQEALGDWQIAWVIRQHIREIVPDDLSNLLNLAKLSVQLEIRDELKLTLEKIIDRLHSRTDLDINKVLLQETLIKLLSFEPDTESVVRLCESCIHHLAEYPELEPLLLSQAAIFLQQDVLPKKILTRYAALYLEIQPSNIPVLVALINLYQDTQRYAESFILAEQFLEQTENLPDRIAAHYLMLRGLMKAGGNFEKVYEVHKEYEQSLDELIDSNFQLDSYHITQLITTTVFFPYIYDFPEKVQNYRNRFSKFMQLKIRQLFLERESKNKKIQLAKQKNRKLLKIGYFSSCFRRNSVGYLVRWTLQKHDLNQFQTFAYSLERTDDEIQQFISRNVSIFRDLSTGCTIPDIAEAIERDEIDILVDLDSLTSSTGCAVMALKPARIQLTWLGFDASGLPAIDYFIADPYVLPNSARDYYSENIWRLPQTYIAVDGFEVDVATLRREQLDIPTDAVIYFSSQTGGKRHPDNVRSQMKILQDVPNSYLLIKGLHTDLESVSCFFEKIAAEEGVEFDRLRFLPSAPSEAIHRANIGIADVVLDTYPYNGTTTTLETLWMEVPVVTQVGEQFASRQGYTLLTNAGITEGIAWTDEEYVEWGIRLGKNAQLRQQIAWKLRMSKQTATLWNTEKFTRELEEAYKQIWSQYLEAIT